MTSPKKRSPKRVLSNNQIRYLRGLVNLDEMREYLTTQGWDEADTEGLVHEISQAVDRLLSGHR